MKFPWFKKSGLFLKPVSLAGWLVLLMAIAYTIWSFFDIDSRSHSVSDTLINWVLNGIITALAYTLIAGLTLLIPSNKSE